MHQIPKVFSQSVNILKCFSVATTIVREFTLQAKTPLL